VPAAAAAAPARAGVSYVTLGTFSWDQDNDKIRVRTLLRELKLQCLIFICEELKFSMLILSARNEILKTAVPISWSYICLVMLDYFRPSGLSAQY
jgi:calcyclin binding protein